MSEPLATARTEPQIVPHVWDRATRLSKLAFRRIASAMATTLLAGAVAGVVVGLSVPLVPDPVVAWVIALGASGMIAVAGAIVFRDPALKAATEIYLDHDRIESAEWRRETGTKRPRSRAQIARWLRDNPVGPGRVSLLVVLGRFEEADRELERRPPATPDQQFAVESDRQYRTLYTGGTPDLASLSERWHELSDPTERHHRRECLALQQALGAAAAGRDPIAELAAARPDVGSVGLRSRPSFLVASSALTVLVLGAIVAMLRVTLTG